MQQFKCLKIICLVNIASVVSIIIVFNYTHWQNTHFVADIIVPPISPRNDRKFQNERTNQLLSSYEQFYNDSGKACKSNEPLTEEQKDAFDTISIKLLTLRTELIEYPAEYFHGRGIVLTAGKRQLKFAKINLRMLEVSGTRLPVQIWYSSYQISHEQMTNLLLAAPSLNASVCCFLTHECRTRTKVWTLNSTYVYEPPKTRYRSRFFPYKPAAIISSTFSEVLFLDCDAFVTRDPEPLFLSDPMYRRFGALFFPDAMRSRQHPIVWSLFNTSCAADEREFDSAVIFVDKRRVWKGLYMAKLMNDNYRIFYEHVSDGDKDTFRLAFRYLRLTYYLVMVPCTTGSYNGSHFCGHTLCKTDSLSQHIYINHAHLFKYERMDYSFNTLEYTRVGLGDPNKNSFLFQHCRLKNVSTSCFHVLKEPNEALSQDHCYNGNVLLEEIEDDGNAWNESLVNEKSKNNRVLMSRTNNLMPHFVDNLLNYSL